MANGIPIVDTKMTGGATALPDEEQENKTEDDEEEEEEEEEEEMSESELKNAQLNFEGSSSPHEAYGCERAGNGGMGDEEEEEEEEEKEQRMENRGVKNSHQEAVQFGDPSGALGNFLIPEFLFSLLSLRPY